MTDDRFVGYDAYRVLADRYAERIGAAPYNAFYERPAILALLPEVRGRRVLDAGCGTGFYAEWLLDQGAEVVGVDVHPDMLRHAQTRVGDRCRLHRADMCEPMDFLADESFDLVFSSLVFHYIKDWTVPFAEFWRVLRPAGLFVFSITHPFHYFLVFGQEGSYFDIQPVEATWRSWGEQPVTVPYFRHPLGAITGALAEAGFVIERLVEPLPTEAFRQVKPDAYEELLHMPTFMCIRARKDAAR
jgi:SAM-dependent methyltransferase